MCPGKPFLPRHLGLRGGRAAAGLERRQGWGEQRGRAGASRGAGARSRRAEMVAGHSTEDTSWASGRRQSVEPGGRRGVSVKKAAEMACPDREHREGR